MSSPTGTTMVAGVMGDPVRHSLSPILLNAAFGATDLDWTYLAFPVAAGRGAAAVDAMRSLGIRGLSVTMPHKETVTDAADQRSVEVVALHAANCLRLEADGSVSAHNTDGIGFVRSLEYEAQFDLDGCKVVMVGAGGAARAVVHAVADAGASSVVVINRSSEQARIAALLAGPAGRVGSESDIDDADVVINATPVGMSGTAGQPIRRVPGTDQVLVDLIYRPEKTELMKAAEAAGATVYNGVAMLLHQAAVQFELWTGEVAPVDAMRVAVTREINRW